MSAESRDVPDTFARFPMHVCAHGCAAVVINVGARVPPCLAKARSRVSISLQVSCWPVFVQREGTSAAVNNTLQVFRSQRWGMRVCTHACSALRLDRPLRSVHFVHHAATTQTGDGAEGVHHFGHLVGRRQEGASLDPPTLNQKSAPKEPVWAELRARQWMVRMRPRPERVVGNKRV